MGAEDVSAKLDPAIAIVGAGESNTAPLNVAVITTFASPFLNGAVALYVIAAVGDVLSKVTLPLPLVTAVPAFPAESLNAILYVTDPSVSEAFAV